ncbi:hypothetical protein BGZ63DRAFT_323453, partial [Mariannaea sp. PMI_226]
DPVRISIIESVGTHDEVTAALVHSFGGYPDAELRLYLRNQRFGIDAIISNLDLTSPIISINHSDVFYTDAHSQPPPEILVLTTCVLDIRHSSMVEALDYLLSSTTTHLFCIIHHADHWEAGDYVDTARKWVDQGRLDFITLSQHTNDFFTTRTAPKWNSDFSIYGVTKPGVVVRTFPPVFPVDIAESDAVISGEISLAMQGNYESQRRDYDGIFRGLGQIMAKAASSIPTSNDSESTVILHLVGHGNLPQVPSEIEANVIFDHDLSYPDFYKLLSHAFAILPAFASDGYYDRKASSSVPAALIAGSPLVANEKLLAAYSYYPREAAWVAKEDEKELDVVERVINEHEEYLKKRSAVRAACRQLAAENRINVANWIK